MKRYTDLNKIIIGEEMFKKYIGISLASLFAINSTLADEPKVAHNSAEWQIWAYSTAAPDFIGDFATVQGANGEVLREGQMVGFALHLILCLRRLQYTS